MTERHHDVDVDPPCPTCGGRIHSGCVCPRQVDDARELGRRARMTRAELRHDVDGRDER
jgi:hypothetical protein